MSQKCWECKQIFSENAGDLFTRRVCVGYDDYELRDRRYENKQVWICLSCQNIALNEKIKELETNIASMEKRKKVIQRRQKIQNIRGKDI